MATHAGEMSNVAQSNPQWVPCNGAFYYVNDIGRSQRSPIPNTPSQGNRWDYVRNVGRQGRRRGVGQQGWMIGVPYDPSGTWYISLADDNSEAALTNPPTPAQPPPGVT